MYATKKLSKEVGKILVKIARNSLKCFFKKTKLEIPKDIEELREKRGVFVTIKNYPSLELRGCIGFPKPLYPLGEAVAELALEAAFNDPRFEPLKEEELKRVIFEISVLTEMKKVEYSNPEELLEKVKVGRDGIYISYRGRSGLLLPQVPVEENWSPQEFLSYACLKAGLPINAWTQLPLNIYTFSAQVFSERCPECEEIEEISFY